MDTAVDRAISCLCGPTVRERKCLINVDDNVNTLNQALEDLKIDQDEVNQKIQSGKARADEAVPTKLLLCSPMDTAFAKVKEYFLTSSVDDNVNTLDQALKELKIAQGEVNQKIQSGIARADEEEPTERTLKWLNDVQDIETEVASLVDGKYNQRKTCTLCLGGGYRISKKATKMTAKVRGLITYKEEEMEVVTKRLEVPAVKKKPAMPEAASATVQSCLDEACNYIQDIGVGMVGIHGMGGVGKTFLLDRIKNHQVVQDGVFDRVISVVASKDINLHKLQKDVAKEAGFQLLAEAATIEEQGDALYRFLKTKKILLFLDDIWQPVELEKLGVRFPPISSDDENLPFPKVVFTTRSLQVYNQMMAYHKGVSGRKIKVKCLQPDETWQLFLDNVGGIAKDAIESNKKVRECAEGVAERCGGLPLALKVIARATCSYTTSNEWEVALDSLSTFEIKEMWSNEDDPFPLLKNSYDRLSDATMKKCFLYCATYPEDYIISEEELIMRWVGLNIINDSKDFKLPYAKGVSIIQSLIRAALLEEVEDRAWKAVKMHRIIRGMTLWIVSDCKTEEKSKWIIQSRTQEPTNSWSGSELVSLHQGEIKNIPQHPTTGYPNLFALFLHFCRLGNLLADLFHQDLSALTCLELHRCENISELPSSIGCLAGLRYLSIADFRKNYSLPMELSNLKELRYLIMNCTITSIPFGLISKLEKLKVLEIYEYKRWGMEGQASFDELHFLSLKALSLNIYTLSMITQIYGNDPIPLWTVSLGHLIKVTTLPLLKINLDRVNIRNLEFRECNDLEEIQITGRENEEEFTNLQTVRFINLPKIQRMTWAGGVKLGVLFENITFLYFNSCPMIKNLTWIGQLTNLEGLILMDMIGIEQIINDDGEDDGNGEGGEIRKDEETILSVLSHLKYLELGDCPKLRSFSSHTITFPSLKYVEVRNCPKLDLSPSLIHKSYTIQMKTLRLNKMDEL